ncbi:MAG: hypothetical protein AAF772_18745 [Acidobacteriota bacterium]
MDRNDAPAHRDASAPPNPPRRAPTPPLHRLAVMLALFTPVVLLDLSLRRHLLPPWIALPLAFVVGFLLIAPLVARSGVELPQRGGPFFLLIRPLLARLAARSFFLAYAVFVAIMATMSGLVMYVLFRSTW